MNGNRISDKLATTLATSVVTFYSGDTGNIPAFTPVRFWSTNPVRGILPRLVFPFVLPSTTNRTEGHRVSLGDMWRSLERFVAEHTVRCRPRFHPFTCHLPFLERTGIGAFDDRGDVQYQSRLESPVALPGAEPFAFLDMEFHAHYRPTFFANLVNAIPSGFGNAKLRAFRGAVFLRSVAGRIGLAATDAGTNLIDNSHTTIIPQFTGSGTTGAVALRLDRRFLGIELNQKYIELAHKRIGAVACQEKLPLFGGTDE